MPKYTTADIRNIAIAGHHGAGKTSLVEALLAKVGAIKTCGEVEKGNTVCDFDDEEKAHQHSLNSAIVHLDHAGKRINLIDTPGMPDFIGHALGALPAVETAAVVVNAQNGVEMVTRRIMDRAKERNICRVLIVNKIDADNIDLPGLVEHLRQTFGKECLPINLPSKGGTDVVDVLFKAEGEVDFGDVSVAHTAIVDQIVEVDEALMEVYLEQGEVTVEQLHAPFEKALREGHLVPICFTSAKTGAGIDDLVELMVKMMPNPMEGNRKAFFEGDGEAEHDYIADPDPDKPLVAHVFKVTSDPFVGRLGVFRIHQGSINKDTPLYLRGVKKPLKANHLLALMGKDHEEVDGAIPGDICALAKVEELDFDVVIQDHPVEEPLKLRPVVFPAPMAGFAIEAKVRGDEQKIGKALHAFEAEDPCFKVEHTKTTHETVIRGLGEMHLRVMLEKMKNRYKTEVETHPPKIAYRETIQGNAEGQHRHKKQSGGSGQFGEVQLRVEPLERGAGFEFVNDTFGGSIPSQFIPAIEKGIHEVLEHGAIAGYPMQDVKVSVYDGKYHAVDSKEVAFITAGKKAFIDAVNKARPVILEPIVMVEITAPDEYMGDLSGDLSSKRGRIQGTEAMPGGLVLIKALVPLAELGQYQSQLKSITAGQGSFTMEFDHYDPVPGNVQQQLVSEYVPGHHDDD